MEEQCSGRDLETVSLFRPINSFDIFLKIKNWFLIFFLSFVDVLI